MVGNKLIEELKKEIENYIGFPYAKNSWVNNILKEEAIFAGKGDWKDIVYAGKCAAEKEGLDWTKLEKIERYRLMKRNSIGIDCSGLVYHLLDWMDQYMGRSGILFKMVGVDKPWGVIGVRSVSAKEMCHLKNSKPILSINEIKCGDLIGMDNGGHVALVVDNDGKEITYVHSSRKTEVSGVHYAKIKIVDNKKDLSYQEWEDVSLEGKSYPEMFDGVFRPLFFLD